MHPMEESDDLSGTVVRHKPVGAPPRPDRGIRPAESCQFRSVRTAIVIHSRQVCESKALLNSADAVRWNQPDHSAIKRSNPVYPIGRSVTFSRESQRLMGGIHSVDDSLP